MYLPKSVSTSASCGLRTLRPTKSIQPKLIQSMPIIISGIIPYIAPNTISAIDAKYSNTLTRSISIPFFLFDRIFSCIKKRLLHDIIMISFWKHLSMAFLQPYYFVYR